MISIHYVPLSEMPSAHALRASVAAKRSDLAMCPRCEKQKLVVVNHGEYAEHWCFGCGYLMTWRPYVSVVRSTPR